MAWCVAVKHGETVEHDSLVDALLDVLDSYTNERTGVLVWKDERPPKGAIIWFPSEARRIRGPIHD